MRLRYGSLGPMNHTSLPTPHTERTAIYRIVRTGVMDAIGTVPPPRMIPYFSVAAAE